MLLKAARCTRRFSPHLLAGRVLALLTPLLIVRLLSARLFNYKQKALILLSGLNLAGVLDTDHIKDSSTDYI